MKKKMIVLMVFCFISFILKNPIATAADFSNFNGRAISLKVLQQKLESLHSKGARPTTLFHLCGVTRINGYVVDEANKDVILIGTVDDNKPPLYLDDFVVALRNAWMKYAELRGNTPYYSNPGCSIDPDPQVMAKLDDIGNQLKESGQTGEVEKALEQWEKACNSPQKVRVMGIPFNSHFAWVMVKADYDMKKIADGTDELNLLWFSTLAALQMEEAKKQHIHGHSTAGPNESMNRFWFYPGEYRFLEDDSAVMIETCKVKLFTEERHLTSKGDITGTGRAHPIAEKFANDFTYFYHEVAAQRTIYYELENLFRFVALAKIMKLKAPHEKVGLSLDYLLERYPVSEKKVETYLPGRSNVNHYKRQRESVQGYQVSQLWLPSCGGVSMDLEVGPKDFRLYHHKCILKKMAENAVKKRASSNQLSWNLGSSTGNQHSAIVLLDTTGAALQGHIAMLLYSPQQGYYYCSKSAQKSDNLVKKIETKQEFNQRIKRYNWGFKIDISGTQFDRMKKDAGQIVNNYYNWQTNNCADFVRYILMAGKLGSGNRHVRPNDYLCELLDKNDGSVIHQPINLWK